MTDFSVYTHKALLMTMQPRGRRRKGRHEFAYLTIKLVALHAWHVICTWFARHLCTFHNRSRPIHDLLCICVHVNTWRQVFIFCFHLQIAYSNFSNIFHAKQLGIIEEWLQKPEATFSDEVLTFVDIWELHRERKRTRRGGQHECHKFAYLTMKNSSFALFSWAFFIFVHFVAAKSRPVDDMKYLFCRCVNDVNTWQQLLKFVFLSLRRWFQFNSMKLRTCSESIMTWNNWEFTFSDNWEFTFSDVALAMVDADFIREFKKLRRLLQRKRHNN